MSILVGVKTKALMLATFYRTRGANVISPKSKLPADCDNPLFRDQTASRNAPCNCLSLRPSKRVCIGRERLILNMNQHGEILKQRAKISKIHRGSESCSATTICISEVVSENITSPSYSRITLSYCCGYALDNTGRYFTKFK